MLDIKDVVSKKMEEVFGTDSYPYKSKKTSPFLQTKKFLILIIGIAMISLVGVLAISQRRLFRLEQKQKVVVNEVKQLRSEISAVKSLGKTVIPAKLAAVPYGEDNGLVVGVKTVNIRNVIAPYNASLIESTSGYELFFRYDVISPKCLHAPFYSHIGVVHLNNRFEQGEKEFKKIALPTEYAEDPRVLFINDQLYMICNILSPGNLKGRSMCVVNLNKDSFEANYTTPLELNLQWIEKNWSPFEYIGEDQKVRFFLEYQINPRKIIELPDPHTNDIRNLILPRDTAYFYLPWASQWGQIRGGTPAKKIGDEYLGFFHSSFVEDSGMTWYVMGAYTFEAQPPFAITGISERPILFRGIFDTLAANTASIYKRVIFPSGFVIEKEQERELIHIACGENDSGIKIVTLDKEKLIKSMNRFKKIN